MVTGDPRRRFFSFQDLREPAFHRVLTVVQSLDLLAANRADLQVLVGHGLTGKVRACGAEPEPGPRVCNRALRRCCSGSRPCVT